MNHFRFIVEPTIGFDSVGVNDLCRRILVPVLWLLCSWVNNLNQNNIT